MSMVRRGLGAVLVGAGLAAMVSAAPAAADAADTGRATAFVRELADRALAALRAEDLSLAERERALADILRVGFDLPLIARLTLGPTYRRLSDDQRSAYETVFADFVLVTYSRRLNGYAGERLVVRDAQALSDTDVLVSSQILRPNGPPIRVEWRVRGEERPRVIDVVVEGVSMVLTQRNEFQSIAQQRGIDGLLTLLQSRVEQTSAQPPRGS